MQENEFDDLIRKQLQNAPKHQPAQEWRKDGTWKKINTALDGSNTKFSLSKTTLFSIVTFLIFSAVVTILYIEPRTDNARKIGRSTGKQTPKVARHNSPLVRTQNHIDKNFDAVATPQPSVRKAIKDSSDEKTPLNTIVVFTAPASLPDTVPVSKDTVQPFVVTSPIEEDFRFRDKGDSIKFANTKFLDEYEKKHPQWKHKRELQKQGVISRKKRK